MIGRMKNLPNSTAFWLALVAIVLVCGIALPTAGWGWLRSGASERQSDVTTESTSATESVVTTESNSTTVRNIGFIIAGALALVFAVWRGVLAQRQAETAQRQSETSRQGLLNERYQKGAEMLGNEVLSVRLGGIYALQQLAQDHPEQYHVQVMKSLCAFVRHPPVEVLTTVENLDGTGGNPHAGRPRADVREAMRGIGARNEMLIGLERRAKYQLDLHGADLSRQSLTDLNLSGAGLTGADLSGAILLSTNLSKSELFEANLSRSNISGANLFKASLSSACLSDVKQAIDTDFSEAYLLNAILSGANLAGAKLYKTVFTGANLAGALFFENGLIAEGLTQKQINWTRAEPKDNPPQLDTLVDHETGDMIFWENRPQRA